MGNKKKGTPLSIEALKAGGWTIPENQGPECLMEKGIENTNPLNASEDSDIKLILHGMYNSECFAVLLPDGGMLNFVANTMEELKAIENAITFYDPPF